MGYSNVVRILIGKTFEYFFNLNYYDFFVEIVSRQGRKCIYTQLLIGKHLRFTYVSNRELLLILPEICIFIKLYLTLILILRHK